METSWTCTTRTSDAADTLHVQAAELLEMTERLEDLTEDTTALYSGMRARIEARATLEELGRELKGEIP